jgi:hypothetical protein
VLHLWVHIKLLFLTALKRALKMERKEVRTQKQASEDIYYWREQEKLSLSLSLSPSVSLSLCLSLSVLLAYARSGLWGNIS